MTVQNDCEELAGTLPRLHDVGVKVPIPAVPENVTVPVGLTGVPASTSIGDVQVTEEVVLRRTIFTEAEPVEFTTSSESARAVFETVAAPVSVTEYVTVIVTVDPAPRWLAVQLMVWLGPAQVRPGPLTDVTLRRLSTVSVITRLSASETPLFCTLIEKLCPLVFVVTAPSAKVFVTARRTSSTIVVESLAESFPLAVSVVEVETMTELVWIPLFVVEGTM